MITETASYIRLVNSYYSKSNYFTYNIDKGTIRTLAGTRICALTDDFLRGFRTALHFECGKASDRVFKRCGYRWGLSFVERFDRELSEYYGVPVRDMSTGIMRFTLDEAFRYHGWGKLRIDYDSSEFGFLEITIYDSAMPDIFGPSKSPNDIIMAGFLSAVLSYYADQEIDCVQTECISQGNDASRFVAGLSSRLVDVSKWQQDLVGHTVIMSRLKKANSSEAQE